MPLEAEEQENIQVALHDLAARRAPINEENLDKASGGSMRTNRTLIEAKQRDPEAERLAAVSNAACRYSNSSSPGWTRPSRKSWADSAGQSGELPGQQLEQTGALH